MSSETESASTTTTTTTTTTQDQQSTTNLAAEDQQPPVTETISNSLTLSPAHEAPLPTEDESPAVDPPAKDAGEALFEVGGSIEDDGGGDDGGGGGEKRKLTADDSEEHNKKQKIDLAKDEEEEACDGNSKVQCEVSSSSPDKCPDSPSPTKPSASSSSPGQPTDDADNSTTEGMADVTEAAPTAHVDDTIDEDATENTDAGKKQVEPGGADGEVDPDEEDPGTSDQNNDEELDETATKLLAGGISISLIKRKKEDKKTSEEEEEAKAGKTGEDKRGEEKSGKSTESEVNPLDVGPNISVTMINKSSAEGQASKFTLSLKSQSELLDPKKKDSKASTANILSNGDVDSLSVSKVSKPGPASSPASIKPSHKTLQSAQGSRATQSSSSSQPMPGLLARPNGALRSNLPLATAGAVSDQLNLVASGIAEYMRHGIEEILRELSSQGSPEATIKGLQLELEKMQWRHQQEMTEVKQNIDIMLKDIKTNMAKESQRAIDEFKKQAELEKQKAILETKKKQWCAHCGKEAIFYCCWNTSYCDYPCQQAHWPSHMATCSQTNTEDEAQEAAEQKPVPSSNNLLNTLNRQPGTLPISSMSMPNSGVGMTHNNMGFVMPGMGMGMRPGMGMRSPMGVSIRPGIPGQLTISRPYFM